jgi:hypothetical protein
VLLKGPGFCFAPAMLWFACAARPVTFKQFFKRGLGVAFAVALYIPWYKWAHYLTDHYNAGIKNFGIDFTFHGIRDALLDQDRLHNVFWFVIPSYSSNWVLFPAFLAGLPAAFQRKTRRVSTAFLLWLVFGALFLACFNTHLDSHWYYANLVLVPMAYFAATAISEALRLFAKGPHRASLVSRWAVLVVMVTLVLQRFIAPLWHKSSETVAAAGPHPEGSWMSEGHLTLLLCLLMLTMILAQRLTLKWLRVVAIVLLPFAAYLGIGRARRNALGVLRWRTHSSDERQFKERWINTLRPTVDRYSTRKDLFVMNIPDGTIGQDPFPLYLAMRKGWSEDADSIKNNGMAFYRKGGARFFLTYASAEVPEEKGLTKLAGTDYFRLYCIDPNGCEPLTPASP